MSLGLQEDIFIRLVIALIIGAVIGAEREIGGSEAGIRTMGMVSVGACLFTAAGAYLLAGHTTDPTRIAAQVVTGVGFLGAGAIFRSTDGVHGLTSAATVWVVAALGMAAGFGLYFLAASGTLLVLGGLVLIRPLEARFFKKHRPASGEGATGKPRTP